MREVVFGESALLVVTGGALIGPCVVLVNIKLVLRVDMVSTVLVTGMGGVMMDHCVVLVGSSIVLGAVLIACVCSSSITDVT
jgi:hypothetical protein